MPILARFNGVYVQDSTTVGLPAALASTWPGRGNASTPAAASPALKPRVRLELATGALDGPVAHAGRAHDRAAPNTYQLLLALPEAPDLTDDHDLAA